MIERFREKDVKLKKILKKKDIRFVFNAKNLCLKYTAAEAGLCDSGISGFPNIFIVDISGAKNNWTCL